MSHKFQGYAEKTDLHDLVRAAMFSKSFPDIKPPEQMRFESEMLGAAQEEEIDLDELSPAEFVTDSESEEDGDNFYQILDDMDLLGGVDAKRENTRDRSSERKKKRIQIESDDENESTGPSTSNVTSQGGKTQRLKDVLGEMDETDKKAIGALFLSIKQMRKAAKLNLAALTRLQDLIQKYPSMKFLNKLLKPVAEIMPEEPINSITPLLECRGLASTSGFSKYKTQERTEIKLNPKKFLQAGKVMFRCSAEGCDFTKRSWGAVNTHIVSVHTNKVYLCDVCGKNMTSLDGFRRHRKSQHNMK